MNIQDHTIVKKFNFFLSEETACFLNNQRHNKVNRKQNVFW